MQKLPLVYEGGLVAQITSGDMLDAATLPVAAHNEAAAGKLVVSDDPRLDAARLLGIAEALRIQAMRGIWRISV